jgi:hypothetical protein
MNAFIQIIIGIVIADFFIAFFHWLEDMYFSYCTTIPIISKISKENEMHHYFPRDIVSTSWFDNMTMTMPLSLVCLLVLYAAFPKHFMRYKYMYATMFVLGSISNVLHRFTHMRDCELPSIIKVLYKCRILVDHKHHKQHHEDPSLKYGVVLPITNIILDSMYVWRGIEWIIYAFTGIKATRKLPYQEYVEAVRPTPYHADAKNNPCPDPLNPDQFRELQSNLQRFYACPGLT